MQIYPPLVIINNIIHEFFPYRGFILSKNYSIKDDEIISDMEKNGFIRIDGINKKNPRNGRDVIVVIVIKNVDNSNIDLKKIKKIIEDIDNESISKNNTLDELFLIVHKEMFDKKNFMDIIKELQNRQKNNETAYYTICPYHNFAFSVPKCKILIPHIIMSKEEVSELLQSERINIKDLPVILSTDVNIIWNGGRIGDVVKIIRNSETSLLSVVYRRIER